ncbi:MAG: TonB-dependent receptor plug domain-containing protein [Gemmatimonadetes bacterium]|nr:TonB-dependent receptor plug domain-containing protein [Gemmatimonadota bacterium]
MCKLLEKKRRPILLTRRIACGIPALLLPAALAAQEPRQVALLRGQVGVDPEPGSLLASPARLAVSRLPLADALIRLAERSRLSIAFSPTLLPEGHRVDCDCTALSTARALDQLLAGTDLGYVELGSQVVVVPRRVPELPGGYWDVPSGISAVATLTGVVRDSVHLEPVAFARVTVTPASRDTVLASAISDRYGAFVVPAVPASEPVRVEVRTLGYGWTRTYNALPAEPVRALLRPSPIGLEALDVLGGGRPGDPLPSFRDGFVIDTALLRSLPAMLDTDVGRATASSPSMSAPSDFTSLPYLRGGSRHGTPVLLDGVRLFKPFHFGGFISAINPEVVRRATVLAGPGADQLAIGSLSGAVDIATRDGSRDRRHTAGSLGLASTRFSVEGPIGGSASYLVGARRTHPGALLGQLPREHGDARLDKGLHRDYLPSYSFHDLHAKATKDLGGVRRFSVSGHLNSESINYPQEVTGYVHRRSLTLAATAFSAHYRGRVGGGAIIDANLGHSRFAGDLLIQNTHGRRHQGSYQQADTGLLGEGSMSETRADVRAAWHAGGGAIAAGAQATRFQGDHAYNLVSYSRGFEGVLPQLAVSAVSWRLAAYSSVAVPLRGGFSARGGVRVDRFQGLANTFAPFGELSYAASWWSARVSGSRSYQELASLRNEETLLASMVAYDLLLPVGEAPVPRSTELAAGWEGVRGKLRVRLDAYTRHLDHLRLPALEPHPGAGTVLVDPSLWKQATGTARGIEATWSWIDDRGLSLLGSYRWARASRTVGSRTYTPRFHREHEFEVASSFRRGASSWSARVVLGSGQPHTPWLVVVPGMGANLPGEFDGGTRAVFLIAKYNSARLPHYARIDVGWRRAIEVQWLGGGTIVPYLTVANLLNRHNVVGWEIGPIYCTLGCPLTPSHFHYRRQIPLFPFIGAEFRF